MNPPDGPGAAPTRRPLRSLVRIGDAIVVVLLLASILITVIGYYLS